MNSKTDRILNLSLRNGAIIAIGLMCIGLFCYGAIANATQVNLDVNRVDQQAYLAYARNLFSTNYHFVGGRNRMPIYPFLLSWIYDFRWSETEFFTRAKYFNIALSAALLPGIFLLLRQRLMLLPAIVIWLITTFTVFMFRAGYVQVELLFYVLNFCCFLLMWQLLKRPTWWLSSFTGIVFGVTHLTKASILPGMLIFFGCLALRGIFGDRSPSQTRKRSIAHHFLCIALSTAFFLFTVSPYITTSYRFFGKHFYNVNSTFYIWYDTWEQAEQGTRIHDDHEGWPQMPADQIPSLEKYLRERTPLQMLDRLGSGIKEQYAVVSSGYGYWKYVVIYMAATLILMGTNFRTVARSIKQSWWLALFVGAYFLGYLLLYAWYAPIASGNRFVLAQFLPLIITLAIAQQQMSKHRPTIAIQKFKVNWFYGFNFLILGIILFELYPILSDRIHTTFAAL
ncbi:hypothetical protein H6F67_12090 [Microcoleus sp. FACHB-1515]|uniref:hypothetical protein n=1 Tax=Cyanophyceae TaxID=3028117 RepID=UPI00168881EC|nr:hypothetical protein [Microcoleus sp. FACHB-1515]MBD2090594.1 hypothetical protein [Microcoleus sp. FACHB-1515]